MTQRQFLAVLLLSASSLFFVGCTEATLLDPCGGCAEGTFCASDDRCRVVCNSDGDCEACSRCDGGLCYEAASCRCEAETDAALCARLDAECGLFTAADNCGTLRTVTCPDTCAADRHCDDNVCVCTVGPTGPSGACCVPQTDEQLCTTAGAACGSLTADDNCGITRQVTCADTCGTDRHCDGNQCLCNIPTPGTPSVCCVPETDAQMCTRLSAPCGNISNGTDNCGLNRSVSCPNTCTNGKSCTGNTCTCQYVVATVCANEGLECGAADVTLCGDLTPINCGNPCTPVTETCNALTNQCDCLPETDSELCASASYQCGFASLVDRCGNTRLLDCGGCGNDPWTCVDPMTCNCASPPCLCEAQASGDTSLNEFPAASGLYHPAMSTWVDDVPPFLDGSTWRSCTQNTTPAIEAHCLTVNGRQNHLIGVDAAMTKVVVRRSSGSCSVDQVWEYSRNGGAYTWDGINITAPIAGSGVGLGEGQLGWEPRSQRVVGVIGGDLIAVEITGPSSTNFVLHGEMFVDINDVAAITYPVFDAAGARLYIRVGSLSSQAEWVELDGQYTNLTQLAGTSTNEINDGTWVITGASADGLRVIATKAFSSTVFDRGTPTGTFSITAGPYGGFWWARPVEGCATLLIGTHSPGGCPAEGLGVLSAE